jgi:death-on-curing protein
VTSEIRYPTFEQTKGLHERVLKMTGGERGRLSSSNLEFVLDAVREIGEGLDRKRAIVKKAAFLIHQVILLHPFVNGNRRTAFELTKQFLERNGFVFKPRAEAAYAFLLEIATSRASMADIEEWIATNLTEAGK